MSDQSQLPVFPDRADTRKSLIDLDPELLSAIENGISSVVAELRLSQENIALEQIPFIITERVKQEESRAQVTESILDSWGGARSNSGSTPSEEEIEQTRQTVKLYIEPIMSLACTEIITALEADKNPSIAKKRRRAVNLTLKQFKGHATFYDLLGVKADATEKDIKEAYKKLILLLHPDKNKDEAAGECTYAINGAKETLADAGKRKIYDSFLKSKPQVADEEDEMEVDEEFAPGAFDSDESDNYEMGDVEETDSEEDDENEFPKPSKKVTKQHHAMGPIIKRFFKDLEGRIGRATLNKHLRRGNLYIRENNQTNRCRLDIFTVPADKLLVYQYMQRNIALEYKLGVIQPKRVQNELQSFQNYFEKVCRRGLHQWPEAWVRYLIDPLRKRLTEEGLPQQYTETKTQPVPSRLNHEDDCYHNNNNYNTKMKRPIIAHSGPLPSAMAMKSAGLKYFLHAEGPNKLAVEMASNVDEKKELQYLSSNRKYNVDAYASTICMRPSTDFKKILGVACLAENERAPETYVRVEMINGTNHIIGGTSLREWLGTDTADRYIDHFCVDSGTVLPLWALDHDNSYAPLPTQSVPRKYLDHDVAAYINDRGYKSRGGNGITLLTEKMEGIADAVIIRGESLQAICERLPPVTASRFVRKK
ncbi:hypothetical protein F5Y16DRAFT_406680 [Xylariaceae sp. FL0255]|nr:hypothetical protein F5Y16DRAFT_406680 [Xylariaceae sp. FL0255]